LGDHRKKKEGRCQWGLFLKESNFLNVEGKDLRNQGEKKKKGYVTYFGLVHLFLRDRGRRGDIKRKI